MEYLNKIKIRFGNVLCKMGLHKYYHYHETKPVVDSPIPIRELKIPIRECNRCGYREHHLMPRANGMWINWRPYPREHQEVLRLKRVGRHTRE